MNPPTTSIDNLPAEMICELFKHLHPKDLIVCPLVNKRWRSIYAGFRVPTLVVRDWDSEGYSNWAYPYPVRKFGDHQLCDPTLFSRLADQPLLSNLKHLALLCNGDQFDFNKLRSFNQLTYLEFTGSSGHFEKRHVKLPALQVLACRGYNRRPLSIDCPKLRVLRYDEYEEDSLLKVKHPETIEVLVTSITGQKLAPFTGVECLITAELKNISKDTLLSLPKLKELRYDQEIQRAFFAFEDDGSGRLNRMKRTLREFLDHMKQLKRADLQFRFAGFRLTVESLDQIDFGLQVDKRGFESVYNEYVYMKNYQLLDPGATLNVRFSVNYTSLLSNLVGELPADFFEMFAGLRTISASAVADPRHFRWFLKSLRSLEDLSLERAVFSQEFYDQLPQFARSLVDLEMKAFDASDRVLNFNFLRELPRLRWLHIRPEGLSSIDSLESIHSIVGILVRLKLVELIFEFIFKNLYVCVSIMRITGTEDHLHVRIGYYDGEDHKTVRGPDELVDYLNGLPEWHNDSD